MPKDSEIVLLDAAQKKVESQHSVIAQLDQKSSVILGFSVVSIVEIAGFLLLVAGEGGRPTMTLPWYVGLIFYTALGCVILGSVLGLMALRGNASYGFHASEFGMLRSLADDEKSLTGSMLNCARDAMQRNYRVIRHKRRELFGSMIATGLAVLLYTGLVAWIFHSKF